MPFCTVQGQIASQIAAYAIPITQVGCIRSLSPCHHTLPHVANSFPPQGSGYDTDYHPADLHPLKEGSTEPAHHASEGEKSLEATQTDSTSPGDEEVASHSGNGPSQKEHKATFMEKMKGEAKILIGKMEGKDEKVEEGQKMKRGEAKAMAAKSQSA